MLDFIIVGLPRSGTTWLANWLDSGDVTCYHDPLYQYHYSELDSIEKTTRIHGVSCTALWRWPEWLTSHPAHKVIVHRDFSEVNHSLYEAELPVLGEPPNLHRLPGLHVEFDSLFEESSAFMLWDYVTHGKVPLDIPRWKRLAQMNIQPQMDKVTRNQKVLDRLHLELV